MVASTTKINKSFSAYFDLQVRSSNKLNQFQTIILRPGLQYHIRKNLNVMAGYALVESRRTIGTVSGLAPEHRIWEQVQLMHPVGFTSLNHRLRLEQRFISKPVLTGNSLGHQGNSFANRLRYFFRDMIPLNGAKKFQKGMFAGLQNELFINIGDKSVVNGKYFDQNRAYLSIGYRFSPKFDLDAGYMNQYVSGRGHSFTNNHNFQLASYIRL